MMLLKNLSENRPKYGISIYPEKASEEDLKKYLLLAKKYGFIRVFTNLIGLKKEDIDKFKEVCKYGSNELNMEMIADIDESVLDIMDVELTDTKFFKNIGIKVIRMDVKFNAKDVALLSHNPEEIELEMNASDFSDLEIELMKFDYKKDKIIASHNFFPQKYTGLSINKFNLANEKMKKAGLKVSVFATLMRDSAINAWVDSEGAVTLEETRQMNIFDQFQYLSAQKQVDIILSSNMYLTEKEFQKISKIETNKINFTLDKINDISDNEKKVLAYNKHKLRGDNPEELMFRSTISRKVFKDLDIPERNNEQDLKPGDIVILNNGYGRYKGELHIIKSNLKNNGKKNVVGSIDISQLPLLNLSRPNLEFMITGKEEYEI